MASRLRAAWVAMGWRYVELLEGILVVGDQELLDAGLVVPLSTETFRCGACLDLCTFFAQKILQVMHGVPIT